MDDNSFGTFIVSKRIEKNLSARQLAFRLNISPNYMCEIEKGKKISFSDDILENMKQILCDNNKDELLFYDLISKERGIISKDIFDYVKENDSVKTALRIACRYNLSNEDWNKFIKHVEELNIEK